MTLLLTFPSEAPYRIDQVTTNPEAMLALAIGQLLLATCMGWLGRRWWWLAERQQLPSGAIQPPRPAPT